MTIGVGDGLAEYAATPEQPNVAKGWHARFIVAFGGAVVVVCLLLLGSAWSEGLRPSTFGELRSDIASGSVQEWYVASSLSRGDSDFLEAQQAPVESTRTTEDRSFTSADAEGEPSGGILVWRAWGSQGWQVAASDSELGSFGGLGMGANEASNALVDSLREAGVPMRPLGTEAGSTLRGLAAFGGLLVLAGLVFGDAPRVGTRWFWFWMMVAGPLLVGFIAYAVMELIGFRRRPDPPLTKRVRGIVGLAGAVLLSLVLRAGADFLRARGVPLPL